MLLAEVDHSGEAQKIGTRMPPKMLLIFANPRAETATMLAAPSSAIDLPRRFCFGSIIQERFGCRLMTWHTTESAPAFSANG